MKKIFILILILVVSNFAQTKFSEMNSMPGAFSRLGFGARGMGMGNAISSVKEGNLASYYNPSLIPFQEGNSFQTSYSFLSLDRSLNFLSFTRKFELGKKESPDGSIKPRSVVGISVGLINSGVSRIDGRSSEGNKTGDLSTSENQFFISVANRFSEKLSIGIAFKFYYYKLYQDVTSSGLGFDIGTFYSLNEAMTLSFVITDINSKYEWDTGKIYGSNGVISKNKFPLLKKIGFSYKLDDPKILASVEFENSNAGTNILRAGIEYNIYENLFLRSGINNLNISNFDSPLSPSFGFSYFYNMNSVKFGIDYAFVIEPYSSSDRHVIGVNLAFGEPTSSEEKIFNKGYSDTITKRDSLLKVVHNLQSINDSLKTLNLDSRIIVCEEEIYALINATKDKVNEYQNKIDTIENLIKNKTGNKIEIETQLKEYQKDRISALPNFYKRVHEYLPKILNEWIVEKVSEIYVVIPGDNLWKIARKKETYGNGLKWMIIYMNNKDIIRNPDLIYPNQKLKIIPIQ